MPLEISAEAPATCARRLDDGLDSALQPLGREIEVLPDLLIGAGEDLVHAIREVALGERMESLGDGGDNARLFLGALGALGFRFHLRLGLDAPLLFGLTPHHFRLLTLFDTALFDRGVAQCHHRLADLADLIVPVGAGHVELEVAGGDLHQAVAKPVQRANETADDRDEADRQSDRGEAGETEQHRRVQRVDALDLKSRARRVLGVILTESDQLVV